MFENHIFCFGVLCNLGVKRACCLSLSSHLLIRVAAYKIQAFHLMYPPFIVPFAAHPTPLRCNGVGLELLVANELDHNTSNTNIVTHNSHNIQLVLRFCCVIPYMGQALCAHNRRRGKNSGHQIQTAPSW